MSFTDDEGNQETRTSAPTAAVAATVPGSLSVSVNDTGSYPGVPPRAMEVRPSPDTGSDVSETTVTGTNHTLTAWNTRSGCLPSIQRETALPPRMKAALPGKPAPTVSSATVDGATLTLTFSEGLTETPLPAVATFTVNVEGNQRGVNTVRGVR